jgi:deoxycytidylate deaminase
MITDTTFAGRDSNPIWAEAVETKEPTNEDFEIWEQLATYAGRSNDPWTQVSCAVVTDGKVNLMGCNQIIRPNDTHFLNNEQGREARRPYVQHAEVNLIAQLSHKDYKMSDFYILLFPCVPCLHLINAFGFRRIHFVRCYNRDIEAMQIAHEWNISLFEHPVSIITRREPSVVRA